MCTAIPIPLELDDRGGTAALLFNGYLIATYNLTAAHAFVCMKNEVELVPAGCRHA